MNLMNTYFIIVYICMTAAPDTLCHSHMDTQSLRAKLSKMMPSKGTEVFNHYQHIFYKNNYKWVPNYTYF